MSDIRFEQPTQVFFKQSGELMGVEQCPLTPEMVQESAVRVQSAARSLFEMGVVGMTVVPGGGNFLRGNSFSSPNLAGTCLKGRVDGAARLGTVVNAVMLGSALDDLCVPNQVMVAPGMQIEDRTLGRLKRFTPSAADRARRRGKILVVGGGNGEDGNTTDAAAVYYMLQQDRRRFGTTDVRAYKATPEVDGVYSKDPRKHPGAEFIPAITAAKALEMGTIGVVDQPSLRALAAHKSPRGRSSVGLRVYNGKKHDLLEVVQSELLGKPLGSLILASEFAPVA